MLRSLVLLLALAAGLPAQESVRLRATLVDSQGAPLVGVPVRLFTKAELRGPGTATSDSQGQIDYRFGPLPDQVVYFEVSPTDRPHGTWAFDSSGLGNELDLGRLVLPLPGMLIGRVVDGAGDTLPGEWKVTVRAHGPGNGWRSWLSLAGAVDPMTGEFRIEGVPPGEVFVRAEHTGLDLPSQGQTTWVNEATETFVELIFEDLDPRRTLAISLRLARALDPVKSVKVAIEASDGTRVSKRVNLRRGEGRVLAGGLGPGPYRLRVDDPRFEHVERAGIPGGTDTRLRLSAKGSLLLSVVDKRSRAPVTVYGLSRVEPGWPPVPILPKRTQNREAQWIPDLLAEPQDLVLHLPGRLPLLFSVMVGTPEQPSLLKLEVAAGHSLEVEVTDAAGKPLAGVPVQLTTGDIPGARHTGLRWNNQAIPTVELERRTGPDGRTVFGELFPTRYSLRAVLDRFTVIDRPITPSGDMRVNLVAPPMGELYVSLLLPEDLGAEQIPGRLLLDLTPSGLNSRQKYVTKMPTLLLGKHGLGPIRLPQGPVELSALVSLVTGQGPLGVSRTQTAWSLGSVNIVAGERTDREIDLRESCPAYLRLDLTVDGGPGMNSKIERHPLDVSASWQLETREPSGRYHEFLVPPGLYRFEFTGWDGTWLHSAELRLAPGERREWAVAIQRVARPVRVIDGSTGEPLSQALLLGKLEVRGRRGDVILSTDAEGLASLTLGEGLLVLKAKGYRPWELDWGTDLPELVEISLAAER
jgi:hypothetical protein